MEGPPKGKAKEKDPAPSRREFLVGAAAVAAAAGLGLELDTRPTVTIGPAFSYGREGIDTLKTVFAEVEKVFEAEGREGAKPFLNHIYRALAALNKRDTGDDSVWEWNPESNLTQQEFGELNLRRKKLSNAIGIMAKAADGTVYIRHDLNEI